MRWFGPAGIVTLSEIRQTGATGILLALHEIPYGEAWPAELIARRRDTIEVLLGPNLPPSNPSRCPRLSSTGMATMPGTSPITK